MENKWIISQNNKNNKITNHSTKIKKKEILEILELLDFLKAVVNFGTKNFGAKNENFHF